MQLFRDQNKIREFIEDLLAEKEVQRMFADANDSTPADSRILPNYSLNDLDRESMQQYRQLFAVARPSLPMVSMLDADIKDGLIGIFGEGVMNLEHNWLLILALAYTEGYVTNERLRFTLNIHKADIYLLLKDMCNAHYLKAEGHGRGMKYYLPTRDNLGSNNENLGSNNGNLGSNNGNLGSNIRSNLPKKMKRNKLKKVIVDVCADWVSLDYIATSIGRNADYLLSDVFPAMLEEGIIERMYPQTPRHPNQKYKAVKEMNK